MTSTLAFLLVPALALALVAFPEASRQVSGGAFALLVVAYVVLCMLPRRRRRSAWRSARTWRRSR